MDSIGEFRSAQELHDELRRRGENIGLTTVYRTLQTGAAHHTITITWFAAAAAPPVEVAGPEVEAWAAEVAAAQGFSDVRHTIEIFGTCAGCQG